jgi:DNA helicase-2/ATP-dependent DNA helicase PcrA
MYARAVSVPVLWILTICCTKPTSCLKLHPDVLNKYQHKFKYLMVDEYQDTNFSQYLIVKKLAAVNENLCVVGDDAQSIYAFRGANIQNILNFEKDYPDLKVFKLEQNYRSTQNIVNVANSIISNNKEQLKKNVFRKRIRR